MQRLLAIVLLLTFTPLLTAEEKAAANSPWDQAVMPQPFDTAPFHQVRVPEWLQNTIGCGYTLSGMDFDARKRAAAHGVTISELGFVDPYYAYYDSKLLERRSPHVPLDKLPKDVAEYKKLGIRILAVYPPCLQGEVYEKHPDWRRIPTDTDEIPQVDLKEHPYGGMLCLLGPYGDFFIDVLAEILTTFPDVDAFSFDGLHYGGVCYCSHCRASYREATGDAIPAMDMNSLAFRRYQHWADRKLEGLVQRMQTRLKGIKPDVALVTWTTNAGRFGHFLSIPRNMPARMNLLLDAPDQEFWLDETNRGATIVPSFSNAYMWAVTNHRVAFSEPYLMSHGNPYGKDSFPPEEVLHRMLLAVTYGAQPSIAVAQPKNMQQAIYDCLDEVARRKQWLTHKQPEPWAAIVMSDNTRNFYGRSAGHVEDRYMASVFGSFRAATEAHLPVAVINDWNLNAEELAKFKVVILPNTACMDERQVEAIKQFVAGGGGLVASLDVSRFDEFGEPRENFALADVLNVDFKGMPPMAGERQRKADELDVNFAKGLPADYWEKRKSVFRFTHAEASPLDSERLQLYLSHGPVTFKGAALRVAAKNESGKTWGTIAVDGPQPPAELPAIMSSTYGKGRVVYLAAGFDAAYYLYAYPYQRLLLEGAVRWAAGSPPPVEVDAPMCVQSSVMRQEKDGAARLLVHLYNNVNSTGGRAFPADDVPLREEIVPVHDVTVRFGPDYEISAVHLQPEGTQLEMRASNEGISVIVPRLAIHSIVVAELKN